MHHHSRLFTLVCLFGAGLLVLMVRPTAGATAVTQLPASPRSSAFNEAPRAAARWLNPYAGQADALRAGGKLFRRHCAECHGSDAEGSKHTPSLRAPVVQATAPGVLFWFLTNGNLRHGMPSWSHLPDERRWQLVTYVTSLGPTR